MKKKWLETQRTGDRRTKCKYVLPDPKAGSGSGSEAKAKSKRQKGKKAQTREAQEGREVEPMDAIALPRDAKVHQALKCRKLKQAFNEMKAPREMRCAAGWTAREVEWRLLRRVAIYPAIGPASGPEDGGNRERVSPARNEIKQQRTQRVN